MERFNTFGKDYDFQGACKIVKGPDAEGYVYKYFKNNIKAFPLEEQRQLLELKKQYFGDYIPETEFLEQEDGSYYIRQKYIKGSLLKDVDVRELSLETIGALLDLLYSYLLYCKKEKKIKDIIGYQEDSAKIGGRRQKFKNLLKLYKSFLASSNIMIAEDGKVYMIDVCDIQASTNPIRKAVVKFKDVYSTPFIRKTLVDLESLLDQKQKAEK